MDTIQYARQHPKLPASLIHTSIFLPAKGASIVRIPIKISALIGVLCFGCNFAKNLGITKRFVGSEPNCKVTKEYNRCLKEYLPSAGIAVEEIDRLEIDHKPVSASDVRCAYSEGRLEEVKKLVPETTYDYLQKNEK